MTRILRINNLSDDTTVDDLRTLFAGVGTIVGAKISRHEETGQSRGFGFVKMQSTAEARFAIFTLNGNTLKGRVIRIVAVRPASGRGTSAGSAPGKNPRPAKT